MTKYLVAVKASDGNETFEFKTEEDQQSFIDDMNEKGVEWAKSETEE